MHNYSIRKHMMNAPMLLLVLALFPILTVAKICTDDPLNERVVFICRKRCCGIARQCKQTCLNVACKDSGDCDGLTCCDHKCQELLKCPSKKTSLIVWLPAWLSCVVLVVAVLLGFCWCIKKKNGPLDTTFTTEMSDAFLNSKDQSESLTTVVTWTSKESNLDQ